MHSSTDESRTVPEGKKTHLLFSSLTVRGKRSAIPNDTQGRWWVRGHRHLASMVVRYCEAHSLVLLGIDGSKLGQAWIKTAEQGGQMKKELLDDMDVKEEKLKEEDIKEEEKYKMEDVDMPGLVQSNPDFIDICDLIE